MRGLLLAAHESGIGRGKYDLLRSQVLSQQPGLLAAEIGEAVIFFASTCLPMPHEIDVAQPFRSTRVDARVARPFTWWIKSRKRTSEVCPRWKRKKICCRITASLNIPRISYQAMRLRSRSVRSA